MERHGGNNQTEKPSQRNTKTSPDGDKKEKESRRWKMDIGGWLLKVVGAVTSMVTAIVLALTCHDFSFVSTDWGRKTRLSSKTQGDPTAISARRVWRAIERLAWIAAIITAIHYVRQA